MRQPAVPHPLSVLFEPRSIAVIGATERHGAIGAVVLANLLAAGFAGRLVAVNPKYDSVQGVRCVPDPGALDSAVDLAVITTPAARRHGVRVLGPNCLGLMRPALGVDATFALGGALPGSLALVSQSGAICTALIDWARPRGIGFSSIVSLGGSTDVDFGEILDYLTQDPATRQILLYVEGVREAQRFTSGLASAARVKPVIVLKSGRHPGGARAAVSHTGAIVGADAYLPHSGRIPRLACRPRRRRGSDPAPRVGADLRLARGARAGHQSAAARLAGCAGARCEDGARRRAGVRQSRHLAEVKPWAMSIIQSAGESPSWLSSLRPSTA
jgi:hypothetical protein